MPWIHTVEPEAAEGRLAEAYDWQAARLGRPTEFTRLGSLAPEVVHARLVLYRATETVGSGLDERSRTIISHVTSVANRTPHCASLSRNRLHDLGVPEATVAALDAGLDDGLEPPDAALAAYARKLTLAPGDVAESDIESLRAVGFGDLEILDANNTVSHLNYTNRVANGLGLLHEAEPAEAYGRVPS